MQQQAFKVLIVDDSPIIMERVPGILSELECVTFIGKAGNFSEAEKMLLEQKYDVALLDINLPGKNGIALLSHVKSGYPSTKVIMLSNQSGIYYRNLCKELGSDWFIDKTSEFEKIEHIISEFFTEALGAHTDPQISRI